MVLTAAQLRALLLRGCDRLPVKAQAKSMPTQACEFKC
jgi:hypothetical protein